MSSIYKEHKNAIRATIFASILVAVIIPAYAISISGVVKDTNNIGIPDPKITAERVGEYAWTRGFSFPPWGTYSVGVSSTNTYTVDAMKTGYNHNRLSNVAGGSTNKDFSIPTRTERTVNVYIAADEEYRNAHGAGWVTDATNKLKSSESWWREEHSIKFNVVGNSGTSWNSPSSTSCATLKDDLISDVWHSPYPGGAFVFAITGQNVDEVGCATNTNFLFHDHPWVLITDNFAEGDRLSMHEITHLYDYDHQCNTGWYDIMESTGSPCGADTSLRIKNWKPSGDDVIESNRGWY